MPRSIIEAMAMELPVVATDIRGSREEVVDGGTGYLVKLGAIDALAEAMIDVLQDPVKAQAMGRAGRRRAEELFDERRVIQRQISLLEEFGARQGDGRAMHNPQSTIRNWCDREGSRLLKKPDDFFR